MCGKLRCLRSCGEKPLKRWKEHSNMAGGNILTSSTSAATSQASLDATPGDSGQEDGSKEETGALL